MRYTASKLPATICAAPKVTAILGGLDIHYSLECTEELKIGYLSVTYAMLPVSFIHGIIDWMRVRQGPSEYKLAIALLVVSENLVDLEQ
jgi:hypothetical protein